MAEEEKKNYLEQRREIEQKLQPWRFWFFLTLSILIGLVVIWVLPDRFLNHTARKEEVMPHEEGVMPHQEVSGAMPHMDEHGDTLFQEEGAIREGLTINLNVTPVPVSTGTTTRLDFFVNVKPGNRPVAPSELELDHTQIIHIIGVRDDLNDFFHIHPQPSGAAGIFSIPHTFGEPGRYKIWSEIKKDGMTHVVGHPEMNVAGPGPVSQKEVSFSRNVIVGDYQVELRIEEPVAKGHEHEFAFDIHTLTGAEVDVEKFLGAAMHLAIIKDDWKQFMHVHPEDDEDHAGVIRIIKSALAHGPEEGNDTGSMTEDQNIHFRVTFPEAGLYKMFAQFRPKGANLPPDEALLAAFWVEVQAGSPAAFPEWWRNLLVSAGAIVVLSLGARRFLRVKT